MVKVGVQDNGVGLAEDSLGHMIEPFFTTKPEGMGMGLSINQTIIDAHLGKMWAVNNPDRGATFYFTLPIHDEV
jgi:two-component system sensor kinase FixL